MTHDYTCHLCGKIAAELYSWHYCLPGKREGYDYYHCKACGKNYVLKVDEKNSFPIATSETREEFFKRYLVKSVGDFAKALR
jgi:DNA-directed RNA polymerase subunit RPC12/RpoP